MKRNLQALANTTFDVVVIGGGVHGLAAAWDAALRGLSVALVERCDFAQATTAGSFKLVHGGLRYLQYLDFPRMRRSIRERMLMMQMAPHLVHPLQFVLPCYGHAMKGREVMAAGMLINDFMGYDRNKLADPEKRIPAGRTISRAESLRLVPDVPARRLTGAALYYDAQMYNSERLALSFGLAADKHGAVLANYTEATGFLRDGNRVCGIAARDVLTGDRFDVRARVVLNVTGAWADALNQTLQSDTPSRTVRRVKGIQLIARSINGPFAFAFESRGQDHAASILARGKRLLFSVPWRGHSFIGTTDEIYEGDPDAFAITEADIRAFLDEVNAAWPAARLSREDVKFWCGGLMPIMDAGKDPRLASVARRDEVIDHERAGGPPGLVTANGIKFTTCRYLAEKAVDAAFRSLGRRKAPCTTDTSRLPGGHIERFDDFLQAAIREPVIDETTTRHLVYNYGSDIRLIRQRIWKDPSAGRHVGTSAEVTRAEIVHAVRDEMAVRLGDAVFRRTDLGTLGHPGREALADAAEIMAAELKWTESQKAAEIRAVESLYNLP